MSTKRISDGVPKWLGHVPFPPDKKLPRAITAEDAKIIFYGSGLQKICVTIYCSTDKILLSQWEVPPGQSFQPADIHSGDETYYVLSGELTEVDHTTGQAVRVKQGEVIHIPSKTWHNAYNFTDEKLVILNPAEGGMWVESDLEKVSDFKEHTIRYKGHENEGIREIIGGNWPNENAPDAFRMVRVPPERALTVVHGTHSETQFSFFVSNERLHVGTFVICPGKCSDPESHRGDEALKVLKGSLQISVLHDSDEESEVMRDAYRIEQGGIFFIPEGRRHQYFNLTSELCEALFIVAPEL